MIVVSDSNANLSARRGKLEGVGKNVHDHLVEIASVNPDRQLVGIVLKGEGEKLGLGLIVEKVIDILHKLNQVCFPHTHLHLTFVDLTQIHHLVDEVEDALCISLDDDIDAFALGIFFVLYQRKQWSDDKGHRRTNLVTDVHKETQFGVAHFLGMDMFLKA